MEMVNGGLGTPSKITGMGLFTQTILYIPLSFPSQRWTRILYLSQMTLFTQTILNYQGREGVFNPLGKVKNLWDGGGIFCKSLYLSRMTFIYE